MLKGSAGNYILQPLNPDGNPAHYPESSLLPDVIISDDVPGIPAIDYGLGPSSDGISVTINVNLAGVNTPMDLPFYFKLWTTQPF